MTDGPGFHPTVIPGVILFRPRILRDARGGFHEAWNRERFAAAGIDADFMQDNLAVSAKAGTVRGLHFQRDGGLGFVTDFAAQTGQRRHRIEQPSGARCQGTINPFLNLLLYYSSLRRV